MNKTTKNKIIIVFAVIIFTILLIIVLGKFYKCPIYHYLGVECLGCGLTRAAISILKLDFISASKYNGAIFPIIIIFILLLKDFILEKLNHKKVIIYIFAVFFFLIINFIIKLIII